MAGAPGSKWSSVCKNIYYSPDIDRTDYSDARTYWKNVPHSTANAGFHPRVTLQLTGIITDKTKAFLAQL